MSYTFTVEAVDTACETFQDTTTYPATVKLACVGTTTVTYKKGWPAYSGADTNLYKRIDYTGTHLHKFYPNYNIDTYGTWIGVPAENPSPLDDVMCAGAKCVFSGADEIDNVGHILSRHKNDLYVMCNKSNPYFKGLVAASGGGYTQQIYSETAFALGYCWPPDGSSCPSCSPTPADWIHVGDTAFFGPWDSPHNMVWMIPGASVSALGLVYSSTGNGFLQGGYFLDGAQNFPINDANHFYSFALAFVRVYTESDWSATLSNPWSAEDTEATKEVYHNTLAVAENKPNYSTSLRDSYTIRVSRVTDVAFTLACSHLIAGRQYLVTAQLTGSDGSSSTLSYTFQAEAPTHAITGTVPAAPSGGTRRISNPVITLI